MYFSHQTFLAFISPLRAPLHMVGILRFMSDINQPSLPTPFYSVFVSISVYMALSTVFLDSSPFSDSVLLSALLALSTIYIYLFESLLQL